MFMPYWHNQTSDRMPYRQLSRRGGLRISEARGRSSHREDSCHTTSLKKSGRTFAQLAPGSCLADTRHGETVGNNNPHNWWIVRERREASRALFTEHTSTYASAFSRITSHWGTPFLSPGHGSRHARCSRVQIR